MDRFQNPSIAEPVWTTVIRKKGDWTLVQYEDSTTLQRAWVLESMIIERDADRALVERVAEGLPYGPPWHAVLADMPMALDRILKENEIWTLEDWQAKPNAVRLALLQWVRTKIAKVSSGGIE
jgi:hypothetical protein